MVKKRNKDRTGQTLTDSERANLNKIPSDAGLELDSERAKEELKESQTGVLKKEYQKIAGSLREEVLNFISENPELTLAEVAEKFGLREHTIRAWKAHKTMGTYTKHKQPQEQTDSEPLFSVNKKKQRKFGFVLRRRHTSFIHYFDKTPPGIICPHFYILAFANGCPFNCDYCYLYLTLRHWPKPTVFSNTARMFQEIRDWLYSTKNPSVLNAGELSDSLVWDSQINLTANLIPLFSIQNKHKLLLLTKSANISELLKIPATPQVIVSWSVNAERVSEKYEKQAPPVRARLMSAKRLKDLGWKIRLRLDPIIPIQGWRDSYASLVEEIANVQPETITIGSLRFFPTLQNHAPESDVFSFAIDEMDPDGRMRIPFEQRLEMYQHIISLLKSAMPLARIGLCKETEKMHKALGFPGEGQTCNCTYE